MDNSIIADQLQSLRRIAVIKDPIKFALIWIAIHLEETMTTH